MGVRATLTGTHAFQSDHHERAQREAYRKHQQQGQNVRAARRRRSHRFYYAPGRA